MYVAAFTAANFVIIPCAYIIHIVKLTISIGDANSLNEALRKFLLVLKFMLGGLIYLMISLVCDSVVMSYNLFSDFKKDELNSLDETKKYTVEGIKMFQ